MSGGTPGHTIRVPDEIWIAAKARADQRGEGMGDVVRDLLAEYAARKLAA